MKTFYHLYKLKKDTPKYKSGWPLRWSGSRGRYFFAKPSEHPFEKGKASIYLDFDGDSFGVDEVDENWFEPDSDAVPFVPPFPPINEIEDYIYLGFETRMVDEVDECRCMSNLFDSDGFKNRLHRFLETEYNKFHKVVT